MHIIKLPLVKDRYELTIETKKENDGMTGAIQKCVSGTFILNFRVIK